MGGVLHGEMVALDHAGKAFTLAHARDVDHLDVLENIDFQFRADRDAGTFAAGQAELPQAVAGFNPGLGKMTRQRLADAGGATLAAEAAAVDLIAEYRVMLYPVLVGGGIPFFPRDERRVDLELVETRTFDLGVVYLRYRVTR